MWCVELLCQGQAIYYILIKNDVVYEFEDGEVFISIYQSEAQELADKLNGGSDG